MAVNYEIYDETAERSRTISVEFLGNLLAPSFGTFDANFDYYFRIRTGVRDTSDNAIPEQLVLSLDELALNGLKQARSDTAVDYTDINDMIEDYLYDFVNGHAADKYSSGVEYRAPMSF